MVVESSKNLVVTEKKPVKIHLSENGLLYKKRLALWNTTYSPILKLNSMIESQASDEHKTNMVPLLIFYLSRGTYFLNEMDLDRVRSWFNLLKSEKKQNISLFLN